MVERTAKGGCVMSYPNTNRNGGNARRQLYAAMLLCLLGKRAQERQMQLGWGGGGCISGAFAEQTADCTEEERETPSAR